MKKLIVVSIIALAIFMTVGCTKYTVDISTTSSYSGNILDAYYKNNLELSNKGLDQIPDICSLITGNVRYDIWSIYLANNSISEINQDLYCLPNLKILDLSFNHIKTIKNLNKLTRLQKLDLSHNQIEKIQGIDSLSKLQELNLSFNTIKTIGGLDTLKNLSILSLSHNALTKVEGVEKLSNLEEIMLEYNQIADEKSVRSLYTIGKLRWVSLGMNPLPQNVIDEFTSRTQAKVK